MTSRSILMSHSLRRRHLQTVLGGPKANVHHMASSVGSNFHYAPQLAHEDNEYNREAHSPGRRNLGSHSSWATFSSRAFSNVGKFPVLNQPFSFVSAPSQASNSINSHGVIGGFEQRRWKQRAAKIGKHKEKLEEIAHRPEREAAQERRQKKKDRQAAKKNKKGKKGSVEDQDDAGQDEKDLDFDDEWDDEEMDDDANDEDDDATSLPNPSLVKDKMMAFVSKFQESLKAMRGAEPSPELLEDVQVDAYGTMTPLKAVGQVVIVSPTMAQISCFDPSLAKNVQKSIQLALQLNPQLGDDGGGVVQVPLPRVSMETRQATAKLLQKRAETCRQRIRTVRRKQMNIVKQAKEGKIPGVSEDDAFGNAKDLEKVTQDVLKILQDSVDRKLDSILNVS